LGSQLIKEALDKALEQDLEVAPYCSFVSAYIKKSGEKYLDLVPKSSRYLFDL
jgi:predicted GNAT family acetyltransferase